MSSETTGGGTITYMKAEVKQRKAELNMDMTEEESDGDEAAEETRGGAGRSNGVRAPPTNVKPRPKSRTSEESRASHALARCTPDFSKVEPRVRLPKDVYKPPISRHSIGGEPLFSETPATFMSPADIVKAVLLNTTEGSPDISAVPKEFRSKEQAISLVEQLQEAHQRLLLENAEAKNTIDHLRLTAKINLYSDPPRPHLMLSSSLSRDASQITSLGFAHAQQAEISSSSSRDQPLPPPQSPSAGQQLSETLYHHADKFIQQLQTFHDLLKNKQLTASEQMDGLSHLNKELRSLENAYLFERDEHRLRQWRGEELGDFDPQREVEGLIFQCECRMDEMKERVEQMRQEEPVCEPPPSPPPRPTPTSAPSEGAETRSLPQSPLLPLLVDRGPAAELELDSASEEYFDKEASLDFMYLNSGTGHEEEDLTDYYQSFQDLPRTFEYSLRDENFFSAPSETHMRPGDEETETPRSKNMDVPPQRNPGSHHQVPPVVSQSSSLSGSPPSAGVRTASRGFHHGSSQSSLGENPAPDPRKRNFSQDGITSPGTDSGFVGSMSNLTPEAAASPGHQRASQGDLVQEDADTRNPPSVSPSSASSSPPPANSGEAPQLLVPDQWSRGRQRRHAFFCSPQRWVAQRERARDEGGARRDSDSTPTASEDTQSDSCTESNHSLHSSHLSSSPPAALPPHHGDPLRDLGSRVVANQTALQSLQAEVCRLEHRLGNFARASKPLSPSSRAPPSTQDLHTRLYTSTPHVRLEERHPSETNGEGATVEGVGEFVLRQTARSPVVVDAHPPQTMSEPEAPESQSTPQRSRCTQTSSHTNKNRRTQTRQPPSPSVRLRVAADEPDATKNQSPAHCGECLSRRSAGPAGGSSESTSSHHCPLCGFLSTYNSPTTDCRRHTSCQSTKSLDQVERRAVSSSLSCLQIHPHFLSTCSAPEAKGHRGEGRRKRRGRRYQSADDLCSIDGALDRAIRAARQMRDTSAHMASSLASGLRYQNWLSQSSGRQSDH